MNNIKKFYKINSKIIILVISKMIKCWIIININYLYYNRMAKKVLKN